MSDVYKIQYNGMTLAYPGWNGYVGYDNVPAFKTLTLYASEGGTVTASILTGLPGDTVTLTPTYNTYYRFNNYSVTGGTIAGNTFTFGNEDATVQANFKVNYFTATGGFEKGSNITAKDDSLTNTWKYTAIPEKYATHSNHTGDIPTSWYATSNRWNPSNASSYSITLNTKMSLSAHVKGSLNNPATAAATAVSLYGSTQTQSQSFSRNSTGPVSWTYNKTFKITNQGITYGISGRLGVKCYKSNGYARSASAYYFSNGTTGTWTATGIAP